MDLKCQCMDLLSLIFLPDNDAVACDMLGNTFVCFLNIFDRVVWMKRIKKTVVRKYQHLLSLSETTS